MTISLSFSDLEHAYIIIIILNN